jgi:hypothetical protein
VTLRTSTLRFDPLGGNGSDVHFEGTEVLPICSSNKPGTDGTFPISRDGGEGVPQRLKPGSVLAGLCGTA